MNGLDEAGGEFSSTLRAAERLLLQFSQFKDRPLKAYQP